MPRQCQVGGANYIYGEILCNREVAVQLTFYIDWSFYLYHFIATNFRICMHWRMAALHATATCWHPELSHAPNATNWSLAWLYLQIDHAHLVSLLHNSDQAWVTTGGINPSLQLTRLRIDLRMPNLTFFLGEHAPRLPSLFTPHGCTSLK